MKLSMSVGLSLIAAAHAAPATNKVSTAHDLAKRNVCDGVNAMPVLYQEYHEDSCPAANHLQADGSCGGQSYTQNHCTSFCQIRTTFYWGQEQPIQNSYCYGPFSCSVTNTQTVTYGWSGSVNFSPEWLKALGLGISGSYNSGQATAHAQALSISLPAGQCGYFTVVPVMRSVCGSMTEGFQDNDENTWICAPQKTTQNVCASDPRLNPDTSPDTTTIFVYTDCNTRQPLADGQNPIWNNPGVPLDRQSYDALAEDWQGVAPASQGLAYSTPQCGITQSTMPAADVTTASQNIANMGDQDCCTQSDGSCANIMVVNNNAVDLCSTPGNGQLCLNCARVSNYVAGLTSCADGNGNVGAIQSIVETPGLTVQI